MISYEGLENALKKKGIGKTELSTELVRLLDMLEIPYDDNISG